MLWLLITGLLALAGAFLAAVVLTLLTLLTAAAVRRPQPHQPEDEAESAPFLAVLVPAHDEELVLAGTLESLAAQDYAGPYQTVVIADNCTDATVRIACDHGVTVLERHDLTVRGKGYALNYALERLLYRPVRPDAFVVIDADTWVAPDFLRRMAGRLAHDARPDGLCALQGRYGVLNPDQGWRAALMTAAFDLYNHVKPLGRERLGLSAGLKGNGMAFSRAVVERVPWRGDSLTEDMDYALHLAQEHGLRVGYVSEARVLAQMPTGAGQAASQRCRWEGGRAHLLRTRTLPLLREGLRRRSRLLCDAAWDLILPPLADLGAFLLLWTLGLAVASRLHLIAHPAAWAAGGALCWLGLLIYILGGLRVSGAPRAAYAALLRAPLYAVWKFALLAAKPFRRQSRSAEWVRTARAPLAVPKEDTK